MERAENSNALTSRMVMDKKVINSGVKVYFIRTLLCRHTARAEDQITGCINGTRDKLADLKTLAENHGILPKR